MQSQQLNYLNIGLAVFSIFGLLWSENNFCHGFPTTAENADAPIITPSSEDLIIDVNTNFTLKCESNTPVIWKLTKETFNENDGLSNHSATYDTRDPERPYGNQLILFNISAKYVGYYYCIKADAYDEKLDNIDQLPTLVNASKAARIYIYVNDPENLLVSSEYVFITGIQHSDIFIPCKPSMPNTVVELTTTLPEKRSSDDTSDYDPKYGFRMHLDSHHHQEGFYLCQPKQPSDLKPDENYAIHLKIIAATTHVNQPTIFSKSKNHASVGEFFELLCEVKVQSGVLFDITWQLPPYSTGISENRITESEVDSKYINDDPTLIIGFKTLYVHNAKLEDTGNYTCKVVDHSKNSEENYYFMRIMGFNESYLNLKQRNQSAFSINESSEAKIIVHYEGYPEPRLNWHRPDNTIIIPSKKYTIDETVDNLIILIINNVKLKDSGTYVLVADNGLKKELKFNITVHAKPYVKVESVYVQAGEDAIINCNTESYPLAGVKWSFTPCRVDPKWPTCEEKRITNFNSTIGIAEGDTGYKQIHELTFKPEQPGIVKCLAYNKMGVSSGEAEILIGDIIGNMTAYVTNINDDEKLASGDEVTLTCAALAYYYSPDLVWYKNNVPIIESDEIKIISTFSNFSYKKSLNFKNINQHHNGSYKCRAHFSERINKYDYKFIDVVVYEPYAPMIVNTNMDEEYSHKGLGDELRLECVPDGIPMPTIIWYKDDLNLNSSVNVSIEEGNTVLRIPFVKPENAGLYKCVVSNRIGSIEKRIEVTVPNPHPLSLGWILGIATILLILIVLVIILSIRVKRERYLRKQLKAAGIHNFEAGDVGQINPALTLDEQADLLPYDKRFEFPRDKLRLGKQLGAGAFGVVLKASAEGISPDEKETIVAVKMVKRTADNEVMKALISELKIMVHLGQHLNVVNLLGAVTKNITKREVMVIVEYCRFGNVQNYLFKNRKRFINQINLDTDLIDPTIMDQRYSGDYEYNSNNRSDNDPRSGTRAGRPNSRGYLCQSDLYDGNVDTCNSEQTVMTTIPEGEDQVLSNNSTQPAWRSNYKTDTSEVMEITTTHLISWAFQVARGMDYLASRKVLHGDLAARNILLCEDNVVKICDFGLARSMYKNDNYKKQGDAPLPIKWLALESLRDQVFSTYTDVWSFGIVLWELFSLAKVPYPGIDADQIYLKLKDGYRMPKPTYANQELYDIMLECWSANPESRPLFNELEKKFARLLEDDVTNHYLDLNEPYLRTNNEYFQTKPTDYLAMMGPPDMMAPSPPRYVNGKILPEIKIEASDKYLKMSPKIEQNSPTISYNLDSPIGKNRKKTAIPEEIPMLNHSSEGGGSAGQSDSDVELSPDPITNNRSFKNFNKTQPPIEAETKLLGDDSYVNVKAIELNKNNYLGNNGTRDAFSNPSYLMLKTQNKRNENNFEKFY